MYMPINLVRYSASLSQVAIVDSSRPRFRISLHHPRARIADYPVVMGILAA